MSRQKRLTVVLLLNLLLVAALVIAGLSRTRWESWRLPQRHSGAVILSVGGLYWMDPAVALIIAVVVGYHALRLIWKVAAAIRSSAHPGPVADRKV